MVGEALKKTEHTRDSREKVSEGALQGGERSWRNWARGCEALRHRQASVAWRELGQCVSYFTCCPFDYCPQTMISLT